MHLLLLISLSSVISYGQTFHLFIGTYTGTGSKGIYVYKFDATSGKANWVSNTDSVVNPSYLALSSNKKYLYAVNETGGDIPGKVSSFSFDKTSGKLNFLNQQLSGGDHPCYIAVDKKNQWVFASNYTGGNVSAFAVNADGSLKPYAQLIQNSGNSIIKPNQERPHVHGTFFSPDQKYLYVTDLGIDRVLMYNFNPSAASPLSPKEPGYVQSQAGSGPRHLTIHPNNRYAYVIEELSGTVAGYRLEVGGLKQIQRLSSHPKNYVGKIASADIRISPDGKFLYASNRGDANTLAIYAINKTTGMLTAAGYQSTKGKAPRNFAIDPTGNFLLVANMGTDNIVIFKRNKKTGRLSEKGDEIKIQKPVCLLFGK